MSNNNRRCYGKFTAYLFGNFSVLAFAFCILGPVIFLFVRKEDVEVALGLFILGVPCAFIAALIWLYVKSKAKKRGLTNVMGQFALDSLLVFTKVLLMMTIILVPFVKWMGNDIQWESRKTIDGLDVVVKRTGENTFEDSLGNRYSEK